MSKKLVVFFNKRLLQGQCTNRVSKYLFWTKLAGTIVLIFTLCIFMLRADNSMQNNQVLHNGRVSIADEVNKIPELNAKTSGKVVYQRSDGIYTIVIGSKKPQRLVEYGTFPRWSPDGQFVAFVDGNRIMLVSSRGGKPQLIATATKAKAVCFYPDGRSLLFTDANLLRRVDIKQKKIATVLQGYEFLEIDVAGNGSRLAVTVRTLTGFSVRAFDLSTGENRSVARGCSASLSPDGRTITVNGLKHRTLKMYHWDSLAQVGQINVPSGKKFDNHFWSNSQHWLVSSSEGEKHDIYLHHIPSDTSYRITSTGDCDRGDFFVSGESL